MKRTGCKIMLGLIKKLFTGLLSDLVNGSNHTKCVSLINQKCQTQPTLTNYILVNTANNFTTIHWGLN